MLGADAHSHSATQDALQPGNPHKCTQLPWGTRLNGSSQKVQRRLVNTRLGSLNDADGKFAALLYFRQQLVRRAPLPQWLGQQIGRGDSILNSEIDAYSAGGRHGVGRVPNAEQSGTMPSAQSVDLNG